LVSIGFGYSVTNAKAGCPLDRLAQRKHDERRYDLALQPDVGKPAVTKWRINVKEEILVKNSASELHFSSAMQKKHLLKRLQRV
jgi:hypothetical protein